MVRSDGVLKKTGNSYNGDLNSKKRGKEPYQILLFYNFASSQPHILYSNYGNNIPYNLRFGTNRAKMTDSHFMSFTTFESHLTNRCGRNAAKAFSFHSSGENF